MRPVIRVINPNSNTDVARCLADALAPMSFAEGPSITCTPYPRSRTPRRRAAIRDLSPSM
jgi:hypothetical protein